MSNIQDSLSAVLRQVEAELGTSALTELSLTTLLDALKAFQAKSVEDFYEQFEDLMRMIKSTKPRIGILIAHFCELWEQLKDRKSNLKNIQEIHGLIENVISMIKNENQADNYNLLENGLKCIEDGDVILIHTHSRTVLNLIITAFKQKKKFRVILAEQEEEKTEDMALILQNNDIPFLSVPEYMLSHIESEVTKVFLGSVTLNNSYNFVTDVGSNSVVSELQHAGIPIYMFLTTKKFSLWDTTKKEQTYKITQKKSCRHAARGLTFERIKFSHDRIPLDLISEVITEKGLHSPEEIKEIFNDYYKTHAAWRKKYFSPEVESMTD